MKDLSILTESIEFMELNLCEPITREDIATHCHVSLSSLEKMYRYSLKISMKEYLTKRRLTLAAKDIANESGTITDIAMKYQYNSPEVFSRAFKSVWNVNPSEFTKRWRFTGIFPKIDYQYQEGEERMTKRVDVSDAYDYLKNRQGSYVLCFDCIHFTAINEIAYKAGDIALLEIAQRLDRAASEDMVVLRIGGDEFAIITGLYTEEEAKKVAEQVLNENGKTIDFEGTSIPVNLRCAITLVGKHLRYSDLFTDMQNAILECRNAEQE